MTIRLKYSGEAESQDGDYGGNINHHHIPAGSTSTSWTLTGYPTVHCEHTGDHEFMATTRDPNLCARDETLIIDIVSVDNATEEGNQRATLVLINAE